MPSAADVGRAVQDGSVLLLVRRANASFYTALQK
jgi:hypothetical protein